MKVSLIYNTRAGNAVSADALRAAIEAAGHRIVAMLEPDADLGQLDPATELVVVAGGDGTVQGVALALAGQEIPLAILPQGTANNIASSLDIGGPTEKLVAGWQTLRPLSIDLGVALGPWGERRFIEAVGVGLIPSGIIAMDSEAPHEEVADEKIEKAHDRFHGVLDTMPARPCRLVLDGTVSEEELLLVEVLNIRAVGPGLELVPDADPSDGRFDVVVAREHDRKEVQQYLRDRLGGRPARLDLHARRAREVELTTAWDRLHIDDKVYSHPGDDAVIVRPAPAPVRILAEPRRRAAPSQ